MNTYDTTIEYGRAQLDRRHITTVNYIYELPWYDRQHDFVGNILGGWQVSGIVTYQTGLPFTPTFAGLEPEGPDSLTPIRPRVADRSFLETPIRVVTKHLKNGSIILCSNSPAMVQPRRRSRLWLLQLAAE